MAAKLYRALALLAAAMSSAAAGDRRASTTMTVSVVVASPCVVSAGGQSRISGCEEASRQLVTRSIPTPAAAINSGRRIGAGQAANSPAPTVDPSVLLIRF